MPTDDDIDEENITDGLAFRADFLRELGIRPHEGLVVVANDETMAPRIQAGDTLIINRRDRRLVDGRIYGVLVEGRLRLRCYLVEPARFECGAGTHLAPDACTVVGRVVYRSGAF